MRLHESVKPISYVKAHAAEVIHDVAENHKTIVITQNGEAKAVLQDIAEYERTQESLALLKLLALSRRDVDEGRVKPAEAAFVDIREKIRQRRQL